MKKQILFFIREDVPTVDEIKAADALRDKGAFVEYISLRQVDLNGPIIPNVGVAGAVPEVYKDFIVQTEDKPTEALEKPKK